MTATTALTERQILLIRKQYTVTGITGEEVEKLCDMALQSLLAARLHKDCTMVPREPTHEMLQELSRPNHSFKVRYRLMLKRAEVALASRFSTDGLAEKIAREFIAESYPNANKVTHPQLMKELEKKRDT